MRCTGESKIVIINNQLSSFERNIFTDFLSLISVYLGSDPISTLQPSFVKQLCKTNPFCTLYLKL